MKLVHFQSEEGHIRAFLSLPKRLYGPSENMENEALVRQILDGTHPLSPTLHVEKCVLYDGNQAVGRLCITSYDGDDTAYLGFYECIDNDDAAGVLFAAAYRICSEAGCYRRIVGPVDASFWIKYRLKINLFDRPPYTGEPYNKPYYLKQFQAAGFTIAQHYSSHAFHSLDERYQNEKFEQRWASFVQQGYSIVSPKRKDFDRLLDELHALITELYRDFPVFHDISLEAFRQIFSSYKHILNMRMVKMAYVEGRLVGFFISIPDYGNRVYHLHPLNFARVQFLRRKPQRYVMLYMGVDPLHAGLGKAMVWTVAKELMQSHLPSIGALVQDGKITQSYAQEEITDVYEYVLLEQQLS